jgi:hypothetical protein
MRCRFVFAKVITFCFFIKGIENRATYTVKINPYNQNKLCALISLENIEAVRFDYTVHGKTSNTDFYYSTDEYTSHTQVIVVGLYADYLNTVEINTYTADNETTTFTVTISTEGQDYGDASGADNQY